MHAIHAMQRHDAQPDAFPHGLADPAGANSEYVSGECIKG